MNTPAPAKDDNRRYGIYRLAEADRPEFLRHLLSLDVDGRRRRLGIAVPDSTLEHIAKTLPLEPLSVGLFIGGGSSRAARRSSLSGAQGPASSRFPLGQICVEEDGVPLWWLRRWL
jgi:hypothetical protein